MSLNASFPSRRSQRGVTLFGLLFAAVLIGVIVVVGLRVMPTVNEYYTIKRAVEKIAANNPGTVAEARAAFDRQKSIEYSIVSLSGKDLQVSKENDRVVIAFAYEKEIELMDPAWLLLKYSGRSR